MSDKITEDLGKLFAEYKQEKVKPVVEEEITLSNDEENKFNLFSGLIQSLSETNEKSYPEELPSDVEPAPARTVLAGTACVTPTPTNEANKCSTVDIFLPFRSIDVHKGVFLT